ncbi:MAG: glycosyltransferase family 2 protein [Rickettsiales bacterium TMED289]|nr:MAG: glycosyltransferase family 2 protein [Rickettsiales bacterium TMED289]|tara:strand:- start:1759 stop:3480 length:1722 start_codon:yes stop_codon:yes gene_type:complete
MKKKEIIASLIIPVLNEDKYIVNCIDSIISKTKNLEEIEIIIIDGGSEDKTLQLVDKLKKEHDFIKLFHNKKRVTPAALNIGIRNSSGKYIIRLDAHALYHCGYIENCINILENSNKNIVNVGGPIETKTSSSGFFSQAIAVCLSHPFGVGNSKFRTQDPLKPTMVETVPFGCFRREIFDEIGFFNEDEPRNEDLEFNKRILNSGKKILLDPKIKSTYFARANFKSLIIQQLDNGKIVTNKFRGKDFFHRARHFVPLLFVSYLIFSFLAFLYKIKEPILNEQIDLLILFPLLTYLLLNIFFSFLISLRNKKIGLFLPVFLSFSVIHISYGLGSIYGLVGFKKKKSFQQFLKEVFPYKTTFERKDFGFFTNLLKYFALRFAYLLYLLNISANFLTIFSVILTIPAFYLLYEGLTDSKISSLILGYLLTCLVLFIDFVDGSLSRIAKFVYAVGDPLDNLPPDIIRTGSIVLFGVITENILFLLLSFISSIIISIYVPLTKKNIQENRNWIKSLFASKMSIVNFRIIFLFFLPLTLFLSYFNKDMGIYVSYLLISVYFFLSIFWIILSLEDKEERR